MAISPEARTRTTLPTESDYETPPQRSAAAEARRGQIESSSGNALYYVLGILVLIVVGYFAYGYYGSSAALPTLTNQNSTTVTPPVAPPVVVPAPSANAPATPVTPPVVKTTP